jgi:energy-coupling factor transporter transmembrane protein EcfT
MAELQVWIVRALGRDTPISAFMQTTWGWPAMESLHFIGLALLLGPVVLFDLRLLGVGRRIPVDALYRLVPFGLAGFGLSIVTGVMFVMTEPDQYIFNPAFHLKMLFLGLAGVNAGTFHLAVARRAFTAGAGAAAPRAARAIAVLSLALWFGIVVSGRLITFYRPGQCGPAGPGVIATCFP